MKAGIKVKFWGVRGSIPTPGVKYVKYGRSLPIRKSNTFVGSFWIIQPEILIGKLKTSSISLLLYIDHRERHSLIYK